MKRFTLQSPFQPTGDQPEAIAALVRNIQCGMKEQVLLGVTGSGKTFTIANVIQAIQKPVLVISHNKTLAAQLYQEFRDFFPDNAVSYFVSYYDYYQPEAYIPQTDTYIEKETQINEEIDKLRLAATANLMTRRDTIIVASVSCIYTIGSPKEYRRAVLELKKGMSIVREGVFDRLVALQYERRTDGFYRGTFRVRGDTIDIFPAYDDAGTRVIIRNGSVVDLMTIDALTGKTVKQRSSTVIYPAKHYMTDPRTYESVFARIQEDLNVQVGKLQQSGKILEAHRLRQRVNHDLEMIQELGYVNGIENYSRYFDGRKPGEPPYTLFDYYQEAVGNGWLLVIDESHMTIPQIRGMYNADRSRKQVLVDYGFRLPAALDNRPLRFEEFLRRMPQTIYVSATPDEWETSRVASRTGIVEQLIRPTSLVDPEVSVRPINGQIADLTREIHKRVAKKERTLVTTLTKQMAEDLAKFLEEKGINVHYLHADVETLERTDILADLRSGRYDVIVGVNLLREGLDLPEVSLVAVLDADNEGFLRSKTSLIQTMGRAARHRSGRVILYADRMTASISHAIEEVNRRRGVQLAYNTTHGITPASVKKPIRERLVEKAADNSEKRKTPPELFGVDATSIESMTPQDKKKLIIRLTQAMRDASRDLDFELAARLRDFIATLSS